MSCIDLSELQRRTLTEPAAGQQPSDHQAVEVLRRWGWVMPGSFELTGVGRWHVGDVSSGILEAERGEGS